MVDYDKGRCLFFFLIQKVSVHIIYLISGPVSTTGHSDAKPVSLDSQPSHTQTLIGLYVYMLALILLLIILHHYPFGQLSAADYCDARMNLLTLPAPV